jgi:PAS domain S-box-containing protein
LSRFTLALGIALLAVEASTAIALLVTNDAVENPWATAALASLAGAAFVISGLIALSLRPDNRTGVYLAATGYLWFFAALSDSGNEWLFTIGFVLGNLVWVPFTALVLAYPTGQLETRLERAIPVVTGVSLVSLPLLAALLDPTPPVAGCESCPDSAIAITNQPRAGEALDVVATIVGLALIAVVVAVLVRRWRRASPALRRLVWPVVGAGITALLAIGLVVVADPVSHRAANALQLLFFAAFAAVPFAFLFGILRARLSHSPVSDLVIALDEDVLLRDALAKALGDPSLAIVYPHEGRWVDEEGTPADDVLRAPGTIITPVRVHGDVVANLVHDASLAYNPALVEGVVGAAALVLRAQGLEAEAKAQFSFLRTLVETAPSLFIHIATDGTIRNQNAAAVEAAGVDDEELVRGRYFWEVFIDPDERDDVIARFQALAPGFEAGEYENAFTNARGERRFVFWRSAPVHDEEGAVTGIISGGIDITERRKRELELERERDVQTTVFESMPSIMVVLARDGTIRDRDVDNPSVGANRAFRDAIGRPDDELVGRPFLDLIVEDEDGRAARAIAAAAHGRTSAQVESELRVHDGTTRAFAWSALPVADVTGRLDELVLVCGADITERKGREEEIRSAEERFRAVIDRAPVAITEIGLDDTVRLWNPAAERIFGWSAHEVIGRPPRWIPEDRLEEYRTLAAREAGGVGYTAFETVRVHRDGRRLHVEIAAAPIRDSEGNVVGAMAVLSDISDRKRHEAELRASRARLVAAGDEARQRLERNLHDGAQQRLVALSVALRLAESKLEEDPVKAATTLSGAREELSQALEELRELARGIHPAVLTDRGLSPALSALAARAPIPVAIDVPEERLPAAVEAASYYVVAEALTNVAKYARASEARVSVTSDNGRVVVEVADDGAGGADSARGSGLRGLADRVASLDGVLVVESPAGLGTTVRAEIPLSAHDAQGTADAPSDPPPPEERLVDSQA